MWRAVIVWSLAVQIACARLNPLIFHVTKGNPGKLAEVLSLPGIEVNVYDEDTGLTALHALMDVAPTYDAADSTSASIAYMVNNKMQIVPMLLELGADPNLKDFEGRTPLHHAANHSALVPVLRTLLAESKIPVDLTVQDNHGATPLFAAVKAGNTEAAAVLLAANSNVVAVGNHNLTAPLHVATDLENIELVSLLLENGADVHARDQDLETPLHHCVRVDNPILCKLLLEHGARKDVQNKHLETPLHLAVHLNVSSQLVDLLVSLSTNSMTDDHGRSPLFLAALTGNMAVLKSLPSKSSIRLIDADGWTPLHAAASAGHLDAVKYILEEHLKQHNALNIIRTAPVDAKDFAGNSALHLALYHGHIETARYLVFAGAYVDDKATFLQATMGETERAETAKLLASATATLSRLSNWLPALAIISLLVYGAVLVFMLTFVYLAKKASPARSSSRTSSSHPPDGVHNAAN